MDASLHTSHQHRDLLGNTSEQNLIGRMHCKWGSILNDKSSKLLSVGCLGVCWIQGQHASAATVLTVSSLLWKLHASCSPTCWQVSQGFLEDALCRLFKYLMLVISVLRVNLPCSAQCCFFTTVWVVLSHYPFLTRKTVTIFQVSCYYFLKYLRRNMSDWFT